MRLHALTVEGFGPYADRQHVDFDALTDAGVFLLTGPTGAGKTSVLDAVCFALYGVVPGDREVRGLRSAHATPEVPTRVALELTLCGRRLRVERWPEWERPKRRGEGTTTERAGARLFEIGADGSERLLSARVQEVGHEMGPLLGMTSDQFMQVVLLPQGGFSTFLKADSDQRRDVLERLFSTQRFARIEGWVHDRAAVLRRTADAARAELLELLTAASHRAARARPDALDDETLQAWRSDVLESARSAVEDFASAEAQARERCHEAQGAERHADQRHTLVQRRIRAECELLALEQSEAEAEEARRRLSAHRRAAAVVPLLDPLDEAAAQLTQACTRAERAVAALPEPLDRQGCEAVVADLQRRMGELTGLRPVVAGLDDARRRAAALRDDLATAAAAWEGCTRDAETLPGQRSDVEAQLQDARTAAAGRDECEQRVQTATQRRDAAEQLSGVRSRIDVLEARALDQHDRYNSTRAAHLDLVERRLRGMAAELAGVLEDGSACQVCGSTDHPAPAAPSADAATRLQQEEAEQAAEEARRGLDDARLRLTEARQELAVLEQVASGLDAETARQAEDAARHELQEADVAVRRAAELLDQLGGVEEQIRDAASRRDELRDERDHVAHELAGVEGLITESEPQVQAVLGDEASLDAALEVAHARLLLVQEGAQALAELDEARAAEVSWRRRAHRASSDAGFDGPDQARAAALTPDDELGLETLVDQRSALQARAESVLAEPEVRALGEVDASTTDDELEQARDAARQAATTLQETVSALRSAEQRLTALVALDDQVAAAIAGWTPARQEHELAESMSRLVRGMGTDNQLQIRLSSYVLATRLDQVLEAADERLEQMRDNRYTLHRSARARSGKRSGLDIDVLDDWTGELRSPTSLSGGETFKLSLALALGLADVIKQETGGLEIETLFIDEGFGMLDPDTLDEVMDCIDDLRSGGRAVGVVSHVTELRSRVGAQLHVTPSPQGSRLCLTTAAV
jgi:DNA repair protein SbcC/Rad50